MGWGRFRDKYITGPIKDLGQSTIDIVRGDADREDWGRAIFGWGTAGLGGGIGAGIGGDVGAKIFESTKPDEPTVPGEDPRITAMRRKASKEAEDFRENIGQYKSSQLRPEIMEANMAEQQGRRNVRRAASRRGLLNSGIRQMGEADVSTQKASTLAEARANINRQANELADLKSDIAAGIGISDTAAMQDRAMRAQEQARQEAAQRRAMYQQLGQGIGYAAGYGYGKFGNQPADVGGTNTGQNFTMNYDPSKFRGMA